MSAESAHDEPDLLAWAERAHAAGLCVLPPRQDGSKYPFLASWTPYQTTRSSPVEIRRWYAGDMRTGIGYVCGAVSGHLELFEFDDFPIYERFLTAANEAGLTPLVDRIRSGYEEATPGGGIHWLYRLLSGAKTITLASRPGVDKNGKPTTLPLIETKGEGGYVVAAPSNGTVHPSGNPYRLLSGSVESIIAIAEEERDALWSLARTFDEIEPHEAERASYRIHSQESAGWIVRPGDAFAEAVEWDEILEPHGWEPVRQVGEETLWRRPGGYEGGWGASTNYKVSDLLHVWTTAAPPLQPNTTYGKFAAYTWLNHDGDYQAAAKALEAEGYGQRRVKPEGPSASSSSGSTATGSAPLASVPPFPLDALPQVARDYIEAGAAALGCPVDFIAPHVFAFCGAVAGNSRKLQIKEGFVVAPIFWTGVVGKPGTVKTPALNHARKPLDLLQIEAWKRWQAEQADWDLLAPRERGKAPRPEHIFATDTTTEAVASALVTSRGLAVIHDELAGWVKAFDAYRSAGDRQSWLSSWSGSPLKPNRKTGDPIYIPDPVVCVTGGIQPDVLPDLAGEAARNDGFLPRLLLVWPDAEPQPWTDAVVAETLAAAMVEVVRGLRLPAGEEVITYHSPEAYREWVRWFNENQVITGGAKGLLAGWAAKAPVHLARIALVLHLLEHADRRHEPVSGRTMRDAIVVVEYFRAHLGRILPAFGTAVTPYGAGISARILRILNARREAWTSRTELSHGLGGHDATTAITAALDVLERDGRIERRMISTGGRTREEWRLKLMTDDNDCGSAKEAEEAEEVPEPDGPPDLFPSSSAFPHTNDDEVANPDEGWETWEEAV